MKQKILDALKTKFAGVSERILDRMADKMAKTVANEDAVQTAVDAVTFQQIIDSEGDRRATEATTSAVSNYEKKHSLKEGKPVQSGAGQPAPPDPDKPETGGATETPAWAKSLIEANKQMAERLAAVEKDKLSESRKQQLDALIDKLPDTFKKPYGRINLSDMAAEDFETFITETKTDVENFESENKTKGAVFGYPSGSKSALNKNEPTDAEADAVVNGII